MAAAARSIQTTVEETTTDLLAYYFSLSGRPEPIAGRAFSFPVLPLVRVTVACWQGDGDFPSSYRVLFDAALAHQLPTDAGAVLGSTITQRLIAAHRDPTTAPFRYDAGGSTTGGYSC